MTGPTKPFSRLTCAGLIVLPLAALLSVPYVARKLDQREFEEQAAARAASLYERVILAANDGDIDLAEMALSEATSEAPDHPSRAEAERGVHQAKVDDLLFRAADPEASATSRRIALLRLAELDTEQGAAWRERAAALEVEAAQEARQTRAQETIEAILAGAEAEPEGGRYVPQREVLPEGFECGRKSRCSQMKTCLEAVAYFEKCGVEALDPDTDGRPCENLCTWREIGDP